MFCEWLDFRWIKNYLRSERTMWVIEHLRCVLSSNERKIYCRETGTQSERRRNARWCQIRIDVGSHRRTLGEVQCLLSASDCLSCCGPSVSDDVEDWRHNMHVHVSYKIQNALDIIFIWRVWRLKQNEEILTVDGVVEPMLTHRISIFLFFSTRIHGSESIQCTLHYVWFHYIIGASNMCAVCK